MIHGNCSSRCIGLGTFNDDNIDGEKQLTPAKYVLK